MTQSLQSVQIGMRYRHFKGNDYRVLHVAKDSETQEAMVVYQALYGDEQIWVRPLSIFVENVTRDGKTLPRFALLSGSESHPASAPPSCPFCASGDEPTWVRGSVFAIFDRYPVTQAHVLVIPFAHRQDYFDLTETERRDAASLLAQVRQDLLAQDPTIEGFNVGANCGETAGQTVPHAHIHLIPRRRGDTEDPRGGVRGVIPERMHY